MEKNQNQYSQIETISSELCIEADNSESICNSFVYEPSNISEIQIGSLYISGEIKTNSKKCSYLINSLASILKKELYKNPKRSPISSFEASLAKANLFLGDIASQGNVSWIDKIHIVCALFSNQELHIAHTGNARILLLRNSRLIDIAEESPKNAETTFPSKTFTNITSGPVYENDRIILSTAGLFNILSLEELRCTLLAGHCAKVIEKLGEISEKDENAQSSSIIIVDVKQPSSSESRHLENISDAKYSEAYSNFIDHSKLSLKDILNNSAAFSDLSLLDNLQTQENSARLKNTNNALKKAEQYSIKFLKTAITALLEIFKKTIKLLRFLSKQCCAKTIALIKSIRQKRNNKQAKKKSDALKQLDFEKNLEILAGLEFGAEEENNKIIIKTKKQENPANQQNVFVKRPKFILKKIFKFSVPALIILAGTFGAFFTKRRKLSYTEDIPAKINTIVYQGYLQAARQKQQDAETALIYKDEKKAATLLSEAIKLVDKSIGMGAKEENIKQLKKDIQDQLDHINKVIVIQNPFIVCDIEKFFPDFSAYRIEMQENVLRAINKNSQSVEIDTISYQAKNFSNNAIPLYENLNFGKYNDNLYILDKTQNQIFKIASEKQKEWIKQTDIDLSSAVSMSIDGNVYILNSNGNIFKLTSGRLKDTFQIQDLILPSKIYVQPEIDRIIIIDPPAKKIVVSTKKGVIVSQIKSENFNGLRDIYLDAATNSLYILNNNTIFRVDL